MPRIDTFFLMYQNILPGNGLMSCCSMKNVWFSTETPTTARMVYYNFWITVISIETVKSSILVLVYVYIG